ncbi:MAG: hypothetical protein J1G02_03705 [Clostridiales bacterium]|nr:hypothetical protein [Clostridiales bacterium]
MNFKDLIGLEVCEAERLLKSGITNFKFVYYVDRKQKEHDKELVTAVREKDGYVELVVCRYKFEV